MDHLQKVMDHLQKVMDPLQKVMEHLQKVMDHYQIGRLHNNPFTNYIILPRGIQQNDIKGREVTDKYYPIKSKFIKYFDDIC